MTGIIITFNGRSADDHRVGAKELGKSLIGLDRSVNVGLYMFATGRFPKRGQRFELFIAAESPKEGSLTIPTEFQDIAWALPLVQEFVVAKGVEFVKVFLSWALSYFGGRKAQSTEHLEKMIEMVKEVNRNHEVTTEMWQQTLLAMVDKLRPPMRELVSPVGNTASRMTIGGGTSTTFDVDEPMADAIRSGDELEVLDMQEVVVHIDGAIRHSRQLKVERAEDPGRFINADVRDPLFEQENNPYVQALSTRTPVRLAVKPVLKGGELYRMYVMDFVSEASAGSPQAQHLPHPDSSST